MVSLTWKYWLKSSSEPILKFLAQFHSKPVKVFIIWCLSEAGHAFVSETFLNPDKWFSSKTKPFRRVFLSIWPCDSCRRFFLVCPFLKILRHNHLLWGFVCFSVMYELSLCFCFPLFHLLCYDVLSIKMLLAWDLLGFGAVTLLALEHPCKSRAKLLHLIQIAIDTSMTWLFFIIDSSNDGVVTNNSAAAPLYVVKGD